MENEAVPAPITDDEERRAAVLRRDPAADDRFCYAVSTTGVYCRPSCPSRAANAVAVAISCHCLVRSDGTLSGYRWSVGRSAVCWNAKKMDDRWMTAGESVNRIPSAGFMLLNHSGR